MTPSLSGNTKKVYSYLQSIYPRGATNSDIVGMTGIHPHQQVFQITRRLVQAALIRAEHSQFRQNEWVFYALPEADKSIPQVAEVMAKPAQKVIERQAITLTPGQFERLAAQVMSEYYRVHLIPGSIPGVPKQFDLASQDGSVVGDAKYFTLVGREERIPPAKFSVIAEYVWLLEKTKARMRFLVFGNQREVPLRWLKTYGHLVGDIKFFFLQNNGELESLN